MIRTLQRRPRRADGPAEFRRYRPRLGSAAIAPGPLEALAQAIQEHEGFYAGSLSSRNNNPGNLRFAGQAGATAGDGGYARFANYAAGYQALKNQITLDVVRGTDAAGRPVVTLADLIYSWAPPQENDSAAYLAAVEVSTGYRGSDVLSELGAGSFFPAGDGAVFPPIFAGSWDSAGVDLGGPLPWIAGGLVLLLIAKN